MGDLIASETLTTRKPHICWGCARNMPRATKMDVNTLADEGRIMKSYWCAVCQKYWDTYCDDVDGIFCGELRFEDPEGWNKIRAEIEERSAIVPTEST